jgi:hypothetical protein
MVIAAAPDQREALLRALPGAWQAGQVVTAENGAPRVLLH